MSREPLVELRGIVKRFPGGVVALAGVDLTIRPGRVHALIGENGAGKSTLLHVLAGLHRPDEGEIRLSGRPVRLRSPADAIRRGIAMVHQHVLLIPELTVLDNLILGAEPRRGPLLDRRRAVREAEALAERYGLPVPLSRPVGRLEPALQQRVEILKGLRARARVLILDEPTSVLTPDEARRLCEALRRLAASGRAVVFVSHRLHEVMSVADRVTVLRDGTVAGEMEAAEAREDPLVRLLLGRPVRLPRRAAPLPTRPTGDARPVLLRAVGVRAVGTRDVEAVAGVSLEVRAGEIVGIAARAGNGQAELVEVLAGLRPARAGRVEIRGQDATGWSPARRWQAGLAYVPQDRRGRATAPRLSLARNLAVRGHDRPPLARRGLLVERRMAERVREVMHRYAVRAQGPAAEAGTLSGGNLQRLVVGRELSCGSPRVLLAEDPTRGLDVAAGGFVRGEILRFAREGGAVLLVSQDLRELLALSDRIVVLCRGRVAGERQAPAVTLEELGRLMAGTAAPGGEGGPGADRRGAAGAS